MQKTTKYNLISRLLFLIFILTSKKCSKKDIISEFSKKNINLSKTTIDNYFKTLKNNGIKINSESKKGTKQYFLAPIEEKISLDDKTESIFKELKKIIVSKKNYYDIKNAIYMFYKISLLYKEEDIKRTANFGYFSTLNWFLINELETHCHNKDIIEIEYILPEGKSKNITIHADKLVIKWNSNRLYLSGTIGESYLFSHLPVDRIFKINKTIRKKACFDLSTKILKYTTSKQNLEEAGLSDNETIIKTDNEKVTILVSVKDEFSIVQRLLYFCPDVYEISDEKIKNTVLDKLKTTEKLYE